MQKEAEGIIRAVLERVTPNESERSKIEALAKNLQKKVTSSSRDLGIQTEVRIEGSVAKDTWLSGEPDVDVFMWLLPTVPRNSLGTICLRVARKATKGSKQVQRFAEHPYLEAIVDGVRVNIVPCYAVESGEWLSATDRTPFHTDYMKRHLTVQMKSQVRLLKKYMKGIGVYGAEIKIGGFSGYLCEVLILHYKSFISTLEAFATCKHRIIIDPENYYENRIFELDLLFSEPLIIVDPIDKMRNVASAVRKQKLYTFVAAARAFLKKPSLTFFYPTETITLSVKKMRQKVEKRGSSIIFLSFGKVNAVPDVLWGQLYKSQRALGRLLQLNDFEVMRGSAWSDEKNLNMFVFEIAQRYLSSVKVHTGPPLKKADACEKFLAKYKNNPDTIAGPYIEEGRWTVEIHRKHKDAVALLSQKLKDGGRDAGVAEHLSSVVSEKFKILVNEDILEVYKDNNRFAEFLNDFLSGRPKWLEY